MWGRLRPAQLELGRKTIHRALTGIARNIYKICLDGPGPRAARDSIPAPGLKTPRAQAQSAGPVAQVSTGLAGVSISV